MVVTPLYGALLCSGTGRGVSLVLCVLWCSMPCNERKQGWYISLTKMARTSLAEFSYNQCSSIFFLCITFGAHLVLQECTECTYPVHHHAITLQDRGGGRCTAKKKLMTCACTIVSVTSPRRCYHCYFGLLGESMWRS